MLSFLYTTDNNVLCKRYEGILAGWKGMFVPFWSQRHLRFLKDERWICQRGQNVDMKIHVEDMAFLFMTNNASLVTFFFMLQESASLWISRFLSMRQPIEVPKTLFAREYRRMSRMTLIHGYYSFKWHEEKHIWNTNESYFRRKQMEISGFEPEASHMRSERSTTELYPLIPWCRVIKDCRL